MRAVQGDRGLAALIGGFSVARPRAAIALWLALVIPLTAIGAGAHQRLHRSDIKINSTPSGKTRDAVSHHFGDRSQMWVALTGPAKEVVRERVALAKRLAREDVTLVGPTLRNAQGGELLLAEMKGDTDELARHRVLAIRELIKKTVEPPVHASITGGMDIGAAMTIAAERDARKFELVAAPLLIVILLLVFGTPLAAATPIVIGFGTIGASTGVLRLINIVHPIDDLALNAATMLGLALGVDYALLIVSRHRERLAEGDSFVDAARNATAAAGHTVLGAGMLLVVAMSISVMIAPGRLLQSMGIAVAVSSLLSMFGVLLATPALLVLFGPAIDRWPVMRRPVKAPGTGRFSRFSSRPQKRPGALIALTAIPLFVVSLFGLAVQTGPPSSKSLPASTPQRIDARELRAAFGGRFDKPYQFVFSVNRGTMLDPDRLKALAEFQKEIARRPDVGAVFGPGVLKERTRGLVRAKKSLAGANDLASKARSDRTQLRNAVAEATDGVGRLTTGLSQARTGAHQLGNAPEEAKSGAAKLLANVGRARLGSDQLAAGSSRLYSGATQLASGAAQSTGGSKELADGLETAQDGTDRLRDGAIEVAVASADKSGETAKLAQPYEVVLSQLDKAQADLDSASPAVKATAEYQRAQAGLAAAHKMATEQLATANEIITKGTNVGTNAKRLEDRAATQLRSIERSRATASRLADSSGTMRGTADSFARQMSLLNSDAQAITSGVGSVGNGDSLIAALDRLKGDAVSLTDKAEAARIAAAPVHGGLNRAHSAASRLQVPARSTKATMEAADQLVLATRSGFLPLAVIDSDSTPSLDRRALGTSLNIERGGNAAIVSVLAKTSASNDIRYDIAAQADKVAKQMGAEIRTGGWAAEVLDFIRLSQQRLVLGLLLMATVATTVLTVLVRSWQIALAAVATNLLTTTATFGLLQLGFGGSAPLGGSGELDLISVYLIFSLVFALSTDYTLFLLMRMREGWDLTGSSEEAISYGLRTTAGVITGAAAALIVVFLAFSTAELINLRQLGVGLAAAILIDATVIRLILLPAILRLLPASAWPVREAR